MEDFMKNLINIATSSGSQILLAILVSVVGLLVIKFLVKLANRYLGKTKLDPQAVRIILLIAKVYERIKQNTLVQGALMGLKSTVVGLIGATILSVGKEIFFSKGINAAVFQSANVYVSLGIFAVGLFLLLYKKLNPILIIAGSAAVGILFGYTGVISV